PRDIFFAECVDLPQDTSCACIQRKESAVHRDDVNLPIPNTDTTVDDVFPSPTRRTWVAMWIECPERASAGRIHCIYSAPNSRNIEHTVDHQRCGLHSAIRICFELPGKTQLRHILGIDLLEGRVIAPTKVPTISEPLAGL